MEREPISVQFSCAAKAGAMDNYRAAIRAAGGAPAGGYAPAPDLTCAGLILCGGEDLDPALFGQENNGSNPPDPIRDRAEFALFDAFYRAGKPILGICRGLQLINVALGGELIQDLPPELRSFHVWDGADKVHPIRAAEGSWLHRLYGPLFQVNSAHHQALGRMGAGLVPTAWAEGGFPEGAEHERLPIFGVQFHPERMTCTHRRTDTVDGGAIFEHFLSLCRRSGWA